MQMSAEQGNGGEGLFSIPHKLVELLLCSQLWGGDLPDGMRTSEKIGQELASFRSRGQRYEAAELSEDWMRVYCRLWHSSSRDLQDTTF